MSKAVIEGYVKDLVSLLRENAADAVAERNDQRDQGGKDYDYALGRLMAYHEVISLMQQQAKAFGLPLDRLGLERIDPEKDLV